MYMMLLSAVQAVDEGLTAQEIVSSLPFDPLSIFVLLLLAGAFVAVVYFGTRDWMAPEDRPEARGTAGAPASGEHPSAPRGDGARKGVKKAA